MSGVRGEICKFFLGPGCTKKECPFWHVYPVQNLTGTYACESVWIPSDHVGIIIGKGGKSINRLKSAYGEIDLHLSETKTEKEKLTMTADQGIILSVLTDIVENMIDSLKTKSRQDKSGLEYLLPLMEKYGLYTHIDELQMAGLIKRKAEEDYQNGSKKPNNMESSNGWGPMFDESQHINNAIAEEDGFADINRGDDPKVLPGMKKFLYLSQHIVTDEFDSAISEHVDCLKTKPQEIVTFVQKCNCSQNCGYGFFRNAVDTVGYLPMSIISEDILKFECAYCEELNEFYQEKEYLNHLVEVHFWRRMTSFLNDCHPFLCPEVGCNLTFQDFKSLVFHYGAIPHRKVGALILDSVGERVKNVRESSSKDSSGNREKVEKLERYVSMLQKKLESGKSNEKNDEQIETLKKQLNGASTEMTEIKKDNEKLKKELSKCKEDFVKKDISFKNVQENLKKKLKEIEDLKKSLAEKEKVIQSNAKAGSNSTITSAENVKLKKQIEELKKETVELKKEKMTLQAESKATKDTKAAIELLKKQLASKNETIAKLNAAAKASGKSDGAQNTAVIEKLRKVVKSQKAMLELKDKEIKLIKNMSNDNGALNEDSDIEEIC